MISQKKTHEKKLIEIFLNMIDEDSVESEDEIESSEESESEQNKHEI